MGREHPANGAADGIQNKARQRNIAFAELFRQRPDGKDAQPHRDAPDDREHGLGDTVIVAAQHIVAEVNKAQVFDGRSHRINQKIGIDQQHIFVGKNGFELLGKGNLLHACRVLFFQRDALFGKVVFQQGQRQGQDGQHTHEGDPLCLVHADFRHNDHRENQRHQDTAHHNGGDLVKHRQAAALGGVAGGQRHHQVMAHIENSVGKGIEQVVADHDPDDLYGFRGSGHCEQQYTGYRQQRGA